MNYFKTAEQLLGSVENLRKAVENITARKLRLEELAEQSNTPKSYSNVKTVEQYLEENLELAELERNLSCTNATLKEIEAVLSQLEHEEQEILRLWYIDKKSKEKILATLHIESLSTLYSLRNRAVGNFALNYFGASAFPSI